RGGRGGGGREGGGGAMNELLLRFRASERVREPFDSDRRRPARTRTGDTKGPRAVRGKDFDRIRQGEYLLLHRVVELAGEGLGLFRAQEIGSCRAPHDQGAPREEGCRAPAIQRAQQ